MCVHLFFYDIPITEKAGPKDIYMNRKLWLIGLIIQAYMKKNLPVRSELIVFFFGNEG